MYESDDFTNIWTKKTSKKFSLKVSKKKKLTSCLTYHFNYGSIVYLENEKNPLNIVEN